eukprot:207386-Alexandrium_andersonii.AAC.1
MTFAHPSLPERHAVFNQDSSQLGACAMMPCATSVQDPCQVYRPHARSPALRQACVRVCDALTAGTEHC